MHCINIKIVCYDSRHLPVIAHTMTFKLLSVSTLELQGTGEVTASSPTVLEFHASLSIVCYIVRVYIRLFYFKVCTKKNLKEYIVEGKPCYHGDGYWQTLSVCHLVRVYSFCCVYLQATISIPMVAGMDRWPTTPSTSWTPPP